MIKYSFIYSANLASNERDQLLMIRCLQVIKKTLTLYEKPDYEWERAEYL